MIVTNRTKNGTKKINDGVQREYETNERTNERFSKLSKGKRGLKNFISPEDSLALKWYVNNENIEKRKQIFRSKNAAFYLESMTLLTVTAVN